MNKYEKEAKDFKRCEKYVKDHNDYLLIVDHYYKNVDDNDDLYCHREFIKKTDEMFFDLNYDGITTTSSLTIALSSKEYSSNFLKYLLDFLTSDNLKLQKRSNGVLICDYRQKLYNTVCIDLYNMTIDKSILELVKKLFPKLETILFNECNIKGNCNFNELNCNILFESCEIDNINSFNYYNKALDFHDCEISNIEHSTIYSKEISIDNINDNKLEQLFLTCHFPYLQKLTIGTLLCFHVDKNNYKNSLLFLPKTCPNLISLRINGKIYSFDFLSKFNKLSSCEIRSIDDSAYTSELYCPYIENDEERKQIIEHSNIKIESEIDEHFALLQKLNDIVKALNRLGMSEEEKNFYLNRKTPKYLLDPMDITTFKETQEYYVYDSENDTLSLTTSNIDNSKNYDYTYKIFNNILYRISDDKVLGYLTIKKQIDMSELFIYNTVGIPIVFRKSNENINDTFKAVKELMNEDFYEYIDSYYSDTSDDIKLLERKNK